MGQTPQQPATRTATVVQWGQLVLALGVMGSVFSAGLKISARLSELDTRFVTRELFVEVSDRSDALLREQLGRLREAIDRNSATLLQEGANRDGISERLRALETRVTRLEERGVDKKDR